MCGIAGILAFDDALALDEAIVARMTDALRHRGPDDAGTCMCVRMSASRSDIGGSRSSISRRPAISRWPTRTGRSGSPTTARSTTTASCAPGSRRAGTASGPRPTPRRSSTSTRRRARRASSGCTACSPSRSGTRAGASSSSRAIGVGVKPLYYALLPQGLLFGSEAKAILEHPAAPRDLDEEALASYLTFGFTPPPRTMFRGISKLGAGE